MKKFEKGDILINTVKAHPKVRLLGYAGQIYVNNTAETVLKLNEFFQIVAPTIPPITDAILTEAGLYIITEAGNYLLTE
jgi:hypothetical protein